nr:RecName: Full=Alpha-amylase inhibitor DR1 [Delonix regia]
SGLLMNFGEQHVNVAQ